ncbi:MAG: hypothetical protein C0418_04285 [Coriobacteriaceae bacterium]|nr:hypothetical protein [Coriobacteriaceae bacterium]
MGEGRKLNCWEYQGCGREPGGVRADEMGACDAASDGRLDGINGGRCAGRACWVVPGTLCDGRVCGTFDEKYVFCRKCGFFEQVQEEEGASYVDYVPLLVMMAGSAEE